MPPPPLPEYKHFCRVCNKGFTCGSALGGHMRAHGASDVLAVDDDDDSSLADELPGSPDDRRWDDAAAGTSSSPAAATHAYALRANPNRLVRSCQVCKNCSKEFTSWELFLEHGRCSSDDEEEGGREGDGGSPRRSASPPSDANDGEEDPAVAAAAWSKGKRSRRVKLMTTAADDVPSRRCASGEEEDLANCLVMLSSSSNADHAAAAVAAGTGTSHQEPCAPVSKERDRVGPQLLQPISFLAPAPEPVMAQPSVAAATIQYAPPAPRGLFECKACKKVFTSHQALGGHRASHKKVKGCFAARFDSDNAVSETPIRHAATADLNNDNGKAVAAVEAGTTHRAIADANKPSIYASADGGDANVGTSEAAAATLSMALVAPVIHELPPVAAAFNVAAAAPSKKNAKMHECSVCHRLFTSGQALGGHKRCHWLTTSSAVDPTNLTVPPLTEDLVGAVRHQLMLRPMADPPEPALDLTIAAKPSPLRAEPGSSSFHLDASAAALHLQSPAVPGSASHRNRTSTTSGHDGNNDAAATASTAAEDEAESTATKRARLTDLKDVVRMDGEATEPWLQVGIGSSSPAAGGDDKTTRE